jgi:hypothetical protein
MHLTNVSSELFFNFGLKTTYIATYIATLTYPTLNDISECREIRLIFDFCRNDDVQSNLED